jgi:hypothetical protein
MYCGKLLSITRNMRDGDELNTNAFGAYPLELFIARLRNMCFFDNSQERMEAMIKKIVNYECLI